MSDSEQTTATNHKVQQQQQHDHHHVVSSKANAVQASNPSQTPTQTSAAKWKEKALQLRDIVNATADKLKTAQRQLGEKDKQLTAKSKEVTDKETIIQKLRDRAQEFLRDSDDRSKQRAAEIERLSKVVAQHEATSRQYQMRRAKPIQVALRIQDVRDESITWCLVDYEKPTSMKAASSVSSSIVTDDNHTMTNASASTQEGHFISEWERQEEVVNRVRQIFGIELTLPPILKSTDAMNLKEKVRTLEEDIQNCKEVYRKYRVRQELEKKQLSTELKQAKRELEKNFSMRVRQLAETDMEGVLKSCKRQLKWLEDENNVLQSKVANAHNMLEAKSLESKRLTDQLVETKIQVQQQSSKLQKILQSQRQEALAGAIAQMNHTDSTGIEGYDADTTNNDDKQPKRSMSEAELRRYFVTFKSRAQKIISDKAKQLDATKSHIARLQHRLASFEQVHDRGFDIDVSASEKLLKRRKSGQVNSPNEHANENVTLTKNLVADVDPSLSADITTPSSKSRARSSSSSSNSAHELNPREALAKVEYLRNLVLQYMSSNDASTREQMEITIGSILKFTIADLTRLRNNTKNASPGSIAGRLWGIFNK